MAESLMQNLTERFISTTIESSTNSDTEYNEDIIKQFTVLTLNTKFQDVTSNDKSNTKPTECVIINKIPDEQDDKSGEDEKDDKSGETETGNYDGTSNKSRGPGKPKKIRRENDESCQVPKDLEYLSKDQQVISPHLYDCQNLNYLSTTLGKRPHLKSSNNQQIRGIDHYGELPAVAVSDELNSVFNFNPNQLKSNCNYTPVNVVDNADSSPVSQYPQTYYFESNETAGYNNGYQQSYVSNVQVDILASCQQGNYFGCGNHISSLSVAEENHPQHLQSYYNVFDNNNYCYSQQPQCSVDYLAEGKTVFGNLFFDASQNLPTNDLIPPYSEEMPELSGLDVDSIIAELDQRQLYGSNTTIPVTFPQPVSYSSAANNAISATSLQPALYVTSEPNKKKAAASAAFYAPSMLPQIPTTVASVSMQNDDNCSTEQELPVTSHCNVNGAQVKCVRCTNETLSPSFTKHSIAVQQIAEQNAQVDNVYMQDSAIANEIVPSAEEMSLVDVAQLSREQLLSHNTENGNTVLHDAVRTQNGAIVKAMLERIRSEELISEIINKKNFLQQTAAYIAVTLNSADVVTLLIKAGADINIVANLKSSRYTSTSEITIISPLLYAVERGIKWLRTLRAILAATNINVMGKNHKHQTALHVAVESHGKNGDVDCRDAILLLHQYGLKLKEQDGSGKTPLYYATEKRNSTLLAFLFECMSAEEIAEAINVRMTNGATCLHVAVGLRDLADNEATEEQCKIVQLLLENGADWKARIGNQTKSKPADYAFNPRIKKMIIQFGKRAALAARNLNA